MWHTFHVFHSACRQSLSKVVLPKSNFLQTCSYCSTELDNLTLPMFEGFEGCGQAPENSSTSVSTQLLGLVSGKVATSTHMQFHFCPRMCRSPVFDATLCWWVEGHCKASVAGGLVEVRVLWEQESVGWLGERGSVVKGSGWGIYVEVTDDDMTGKEWWVSCIRACSEKWQRFWRFYEFSTGMLGYFFCLSMILQLSFM